MFLGDFMLEEKIEKFKNIINKRNNIVFFGGAGVSTESGIPDFRSQNGLYNQKYKFPPEEILSHHFFYENTDEFFKFYRDKMNSLKFKPNITHLKLADLEKKGKLRAVITQNIDGLHQRAESKIVYELHGSIMRNYCTKCHKFYDADFIFKSRGIPYCKCGGIIKPDVVLYEEPLDEEIFTSSIKVISSCDTLIIGGTSLTVYPASGLIRYFKGNNLILINKSTTPFDNIAKLVINDSLGKVFSNL